jgi:HlyD family secretion protein
VKRKRLWFIAVLVLAGLSGLIFWQFTDGGKESPYVTMPVKKGDITQVVTATGSLQAVVTVQVGSQVSGTIAKLYADFNSKVKAGQVVAELDQDKFKAAVDEAKANVLSAQATAGKAKVGVEDTLRTLERNRELRKRDLVAQSDLDAAQTAYDSAVAQLNVNQAQVEQAKAGLDQAAVDLNHTIIRSPVDGIVVSRNVDVGQTVAASLQAPVLFLIANDLAKMQVDTNVSEGDVGNVWVDQEANFTVDAYPTRRFKGKVLQVRNAPIMVQNVVSYDAVVAVDNKELLLKPGMTANVEFLVSQRNEVLKVPNAALRFKPPWEKKDAEEVARQAGRADGGRGSRGGARKASGSGGGGEGRSAKVYVLKDMQPAQAQARLGVSDGSYTEVLGGEITEGQEVILAMSEGAKAATQPPARTKGLPWFR